MKISELSALQIAHTWPLLAPMIIEAIDITDNELTEIEVMRRCLSGQFRLFVAIDKDKIIGVQTIEHLPAENLINLVTTGGIELEKWQDAILETIEGIAREQQCTAIQTRGRMGWLKQLKRNGFKPLLFVARKEVKS